MDPGSVLHGLGVAVISSQRDQQPISSHPGPPVRRPAALGCRRTGPPRPLDNGTAVVWLDFGEVADELSSDPVEPVDSWSFQAGHRLGGRPWPSG